MDKKCYCVNVQYHVSDHDFTAEVKAVVNASDPINAMAMVLESLGSIAEAVSFRVAEV